MVRKSHIVLCFLLLVAVVGALFAPTGTFGHLRLDDWGYTLGCPFVRDGLSVKNIVRAFTDFGNGAIWMPLTYLSYMCGLTLFGTGWAEHHLVNVALHVANAVLILLLVWRLLPSFGVARTRGTLLAALAVTLAWAIHPMRVEPVAWIAARKEMLWSFFALLALFPWLRYLESGGKGRWTLAFVLFLCACLSKPTALCFPFLALGVHLSALPSVRRRFTAYVPFLLVSVLVGALTVYSQSHPTGFKTIDIYDTTLVWRLLNAAVSLGLYGWHTLASWEVRFDYRAVFEGWPLETALGLSVLVVLLAGFAVLLVRLRKGSAGRRAAIGAFWGVLIPLVPALGVFGIVGDHAYADRYAYLASAALTVPGVLLVWRAFRRFPRIVMGTVLTVLVAEGVVAMRVVRSFRDDVTVFTRVLEHDPDHWRALEYVGAEYCARLGRMDEGVKMLKRSLRLSPRPSSAATLAYVLALRGEKGDFAEVRRLGEKVWANPKRDEGGMMLEALGIVAMREGRDPEAIRFLSQSLVAPRRGHSNVHTLLNLGLCLANVGRDREALAVLGKLSATRDETVRNRAQEAIRAVSGNEPYARFEWR